MTNTLKFDALTPDVQEMLVEKNRSIFADLHSESINDMFVDSRIKFEDIFCLPRFGTNCTMLDEDLRGVRLATWLINNVYDELVTPKMYFLGMEKQYKSRKSNIAVIRSGALTGTCSDEFFTQPIFDFIAKPDNKTTLNDLVYECLENARVSEDKWNQDNYSDDKGIFDYLLNLEEDYTEDGEVIHQYAIAS